MPRTLANVLAEVETLPDDWALVVLDRALATGLCTPKEMIAQAKQGSERVQWLVVIADARATTTVHSLIRSAWYRANLPTPTLRSTLVTPAGVVSAVCATEYHRFAVATTATAEQRAWLARRGWRVVVVTEQKVLAASASDLAERVRAEHLQHLGTVGVGRKPTRRSKREPRSRR